MDDFSRMLPELSDYTVNRGVEVVEVVSEPKLSLSAHSARKTLKADYSVASMVKSKPSVTEASKHADKPWLMVQFTERYKVKFHDGREMMISLRGGELFLGDDLIASDIRDIEGTKKAIENKFEKVPNIDEILANCDNMIAALEARQTTEEVTEEVTEEAPIAKVINLEERKKCQKNVTIAKNSPISKNSVSTALNTTEIIHARHKEGPRTNKAPGMVQEIGTRKEDKTRYKSRGFEIGAYRPYAAVG